MAGGGGRIRAIKLGLIIGRVSFEYHNADLKEKNRRMWQYLAIGGLRVRGFGIRGLCVRTVSVGGFVLRGGGELVGGLGATGLLRGGGHQPAPPLPGFCWLVPGPRCFTLYQTLRCAVVGGGGDGDGDPYKWQFCKHATFIACFETTATL